MLHSSTIDKSTVFKFPKTVDFISFKDIHFAISSETANWLVLFNEFQRDLLVKFLNGESVGIVFDYSLKENRKSDFDRLLMQIISKKFADINNRPFLITENLNESIEIYITNDCNLKCKHCFLIETKKLDDELLLEDWKKIISDFKIFGGKNITFTGGEVLKYKDFFEIVKFSKELEFSITVLSNGIMWSEKSINLFSNYIDEIQISIDGFDENSNSYFRNEFTFNKSLNTALGFAKKKIRTTIASTLPAEKINEWKNSFVTFVNQINKDLENKINFKISRKLLNGANIEFNDTSSYSSVAQEIANEIYPNYEIKNFILNHKSNFGYKNCGLGNITVNSNGDIYLCNRITDIQKIGNLKKLTFKDLFELSEQIYSKTSVDNVLPCKECVLKYICSGGCRLDNSNMEPFNNLKISEIKCSTEKMNKIFELMLQSTRFLYKINN